MKKKILLVDDDYNILDLLFNFLTIKGFDVQTVENGYFALKKMENFKPDIIILDIMMPRLDGFEVCRRIRSFSDSGVAKIPIIISSALNHLNVVKKAISAGANDYIVKPINLQTLLSKINRYIKIESLLKKDNVDDNLLTVEKLDKGLVISVQGEINESSFTLFVKNIDHLPNADFVILLFQNTKDVDRIEPAILDEFISSFSGISIKKKVVAVEQKDLYILLEANCFAKKLLMFNTLMEAYENIKMG